MLWLLFAIARLDVATTLGGAPAHVEGPHLAQGWGISGCRRAFNSPMSSVDTGTS